MNSAASGRLSGKTAVITGGAAGIGRASSLMFAKEGARVVIIDINEEAARETVEMITAAGGSAHFFRTTSQANWICWTIGYRKSA